MESEHLLHQGDHGTVAGDVLKSGKTDGVLDANNIRQ